MKKIIYLSLIVLILVGCNKKVNQDIEIKNQNKKEEVVENSIISDDLKKENYIDNNPFKISFYTKSNRLYKKLYTFESHVEAMKEIGVFSIILSDEEEVIGNSIKNLFKKKIESNPEINNYKIGYNIKFTINDGTVIEENILRPLNYGNYKISPYLYAWLYDDINANGWHSHIEENEFNDNTIMSSIKLMWGPSSNEINSNIELSVFTYDEDDFDNSGNYRGVSKFTTIIERN